MIDVVHDFIGPPMTNAVVGEDDDVEAGPSGSTQYYDELFAKIEAKSYPGCTTFSSLNFLAKLLHLKVMYKWSNKSFDALLVLLKEALPKETKLPESHYDAKKWMKKLGLGYESIHACKNDYSLFWKEHADKENCPVCHEGRWVDKNARGKKVPHKVL